MIPPSHADARPLQHVQARTQHHTLTTTHVQVPEEVPAEIMEEVHWDHSSQIGQADFVEDAADEIPEEMIGEHERERNERAVDDVIEVGALPECGVWEADEEDIQCMDEDVRVAEGISPPLEDAAGRTGYVCNV